MRAIVNLIVAAMVVVGLTGCATTAKEPMKVKCPGCGYEFVVPEVPAGG